MQILKRGPIERIIRRLERNPTAVVTMATLSMRFSKDWMRVRAGDIDVSEFRRRGFTHLGSVSGGMAGAAAGAVAGSVLVPGVGTVIGALGGSILGDEVGTRFGRAAVEHTEVQVMRRWSTETPPPTFEEASRPASTEATSELRHRRTL